MFFFKADVFQTCYCHSLRSKKSVSYDNVGHDIVYSISSIKQHTFSQLILSFARFNWFSMTFFLLAKKYLLCLCDQMYPKRIQVGSGNTDKVEEG